MFSTAVQLIEKHFRMKIPVLKLSVSVFPAPAPALLNCHFDDFLLFIGPDLAQDHELSCKDI